MKQLTCEMCGSNDLIKQDGVFVCQSCGCKYSVEEAKKMMVEGTVEVTGTVKVDTSGDSENLYRLGCLALEDGEWGKADKFFDDALNINAEYAECYLGKLMTELRVRKKEDLKDCKEPFDDNKNYQKAVRFGNEELRNELAEYLDFIKQKKLAEEEALHLKTKQKMERYSVLNKRCTLSAGDHHTVGLKSDGTVVATEYYDLSIYNTYLGQCDVSDWSDIVSISAGNCHTIGLKSDGMVVAVGKNENGQCNVFDWSDIVAISAGYNHTIGLKSNGTVVGVGENKFGECNVFDWSGIVSISAGVYHTVGLKSDGTVVAVGYNEDGRCNVSDWHDIVAISAGVYHTVGLKSDGTVVIVGTNEKGEFDISDWNDIVAISAVLHMVGLKLDGTVVAKRGTTYHGQDNVFDWADIVAISAGFGHTVGLKSNGTVVAVGTNDHGECNVSDWADIALPPKETTLEELFAREKREHEERLKIEQERQEQERLAKEKQEQERLAREEKERQERLAKEKQMADYRNRGVCQYCGGELKGLFSKTCTKCGRKKDY